MVHQTIIGEHVLGPPSRANVLGAVSAAGMFVAARYGCGLKIKSSVLVGAIAYVILLNYYFPIHKALISKDKYMYVYWYITVILWGVILSVTLYLTLSDTEERAQSACNRGNLCTRCAHPI